MGAERFCKASDHRAEYHENPNRTGYYYYGMKLTRLMHRVTSGDNTGRTKRRWVGWGWYCPGCERIEIDEV